MRLTDRNARARKFRSRIDARARPLASRLSKFLDKLLKREIQLILRSGRFALPVQKAITDDDRRELYNLIRTFGVRRMEVTAAESAKELKGEWVRRPEVYRQFYKEKEVKIWEYLKDNRTDLSDRIRDHLLRYERERDPSKPRMTYTNLTRRLYSDMRSKGAFSPARAEMIARTEIAQAENFGIIQGMEMSGVRRIQWVTISDDRSREDHLAMDGVEVGVGEVFRLPDGTELRFPGDPDGPPHQIINCRCTVVPTEFDVDEEFADLDEEAELEDDSQVMADLSSEEDGPSTIELPEPDEEPGPYVPYSSDLADGSVKSASEFNLESFAESYAQAKSGDAGGQREVRDQIRGLVESYGLVDREGGTRIVLDAPMPDNAGAFYRIGEGVKGPIHVSSGVRAEIDAFLAGDRSAKSVDGMTTLIHEQLHASSPLREGAYKGLNQLLEEVTTETAARRITREAFDLGDDVRSSVTLGARDTYQAWIDEVIGAVFRAEIPINTSNPNDFDDVFERFSFVFKRGDGRELNSPRSTSDAYANSILEVLGLKDSPQAAEMRDRLFKELFQAVNNLKEKGYKL